MKRLCSIACLATMFFTASTASVFAQSPKYVFYFIGDGLGASQRQVAEYYQQQVTGDSSLKLAMNSMSVTGINTTYSKDSLITDSAAAGTALATGYKTNNGVISQLPDGRDVKSLIEAAEENGWVTGIATTTRLTHATPAVFASHNQDRNAENEIAADMSDSGVAFMAGGGYRHFVPEAGEFKSKRKDDRNLVQEMSQQGYTTFIGEDQAPQFNSFTPKKDAKVFAALTSSHLPYEIDRINSEQDKTPALPEIVAKGIQVLESHDKPFFFMVEAGRIDHACHANDVAGSIMDTLALDKAIKVALDFKNQHPAETLVVLVGDHETGGLGLGFAKNYFLKMEAVQATKASIEDVMAKVYTGDKESYLKTVADKFGLGDMTDQEKSRLLDAAAQQDKGVKDVVRYGSYSPTQVAVAHILSERANVEWTTFAHTATQIPMGAEGVGAMEFMGFKDNTEIAKTMAHILGLHLSTVNNKVALAQ
jgi:alkaline phosphatase